MSRLRVLALEPYYGGSHKAVLDLLADHVDADWTLLTMPARKWKWRMRGAAIMLAEQTAELVRHAKDRPSFDVIFASTFLNLAEFRGLSAPEVAAVPAIVYFHENQLVYPNRYSAEWDYQFPLTNITTALSADCCLFNTAWNRDEFLREIPAFIRQFPDHHPTGLAERIGAKSLVLAPPFDPEPFDAVKPHRTEHCRIVWPHRWEHDKNPDEFFSAVGRLASEGLDFEVVVAGQSFRETREAMARAARELGPRLVHCEEPSTRAQYAALLASADVAVSTASNEFFGLAMIEACYAGATPLVPDRLAYRELYPASCRYGSPDELVARLRGHVLHRPPVSSARSLAERFTIGAMAPAYAGAIEKVARG